MSLRFQINIYVLVSSLLLLVIGSSVVIWQAKNAVEKEVDSSITLAKNLIKLGFSKSQKAQWDEAYWLRHLTSLKQTRHLTIQLKSPSENYPQFDKNKVRQDPKEIPPQWFINLVSVDSVLVEHEIIFNDGKKYTFFIKADPLDEITEVWQESLTFFSVLFLLTLFTFLTINLAFNKAVKSIAIIVNNLKHIETGEYRQKLPVFSTSEYNDIAMAINHMTDVMASTEQENRELTLHSLNIQEEERRYLSQELHDELGQSLTAIKVMAVTANHEQSNTAEITDSIIQICDHLITVVRNMMHQLHPLILSELGLKAALEDLVNQWLTRNPEISMALKCSHQANQLNNNAATQVFRIIQECLTNVIRHAEAKQVNIELLVSNNYSQTLLLKVIDDGVGCDIDSKISGFGLRGMQERIKMLGGELNIQSEPNRGMTVTANIPVL